MAPPLFSSVYGKCLAWFLTVTRIPLLEYIFGGVVGVVALAILLLCMRARIAERNRPRVLYFDELTEKPILYDIQLDLETGLANGEESALWREIMPLSLHPVDLSPLTIPPPKTSIEARNPLMSVLSTVAVMIAMPSPSPTIQPSHNHDEDNPDDDVYIPYVELGAADVEIPREVPQSNPTSKSKNKNKTSSRAA
ncbi:hypothetical protein C8R45DRAFT_1216118 [Mycena sanguinolenta]|nr:hypothetical protein C8R45DRAFT_1216118 [Mycena sanguinolenta]